MSSAIATSSPDSLSSGLDMLQDVGSGSELPASNVSKREVDKGSVEKTKATATAVT